MRRLILLCSLLLSISFLKAQSEPSLDPNDFYKPAHNPVLGPDSSYKFLDPLSNKEVRWQRADVFNPAAVVRKGKVCVLFRAEDNPEAAIGGRTSRIGLAESADGIHFTKYPYPVLYPSRDHFGSYDHPGGCEDPRIVQTSDGLYVLLYTSWNGKVARLSVAFSKDLIHWEKNGPAFLKADGGKFMDSWSKSGSVVTRMDHGRIIAAKIKGKYWMYWGEQFINLAWSENLHDWYPLLSDLGGLRKVAKPRKGKFDSDLTECGPPALWTQKGIILLYNGKNATDENADPFLPRGTYSTGEIVFDPLDPARVIGRSEAPFLKPTLPHEMSGQYQAGTTFAEGLVYFKGRWILYYGTADSFVGVAETPEK